MTLSTTPTPIAGALLVSGTARTDGRGSFARLFCEQELAHVLGGRRVVQINHSLTRQRGAIRGLHYQAPPHAEMKFVRCLKGRVWDVTVDVRASSPTFLRWHAQELTAADGRMLVVPEGCAHGFQALEPGSELLYLHTSAYTPASESGVRFDDPRLAIAWPIPPGEVSERDRAFALLGAGFEGVCA